MDSDGGLEPWFSVSGHMSKSFEVQRTIMRVEAPALFMVLPKLIGLADIHSDNRGVQALNKGQVDA